eukprot:6191205-Pleurochrysis_carterae.AAC.6
MDTGYGWLLCGKCLKHEIMCASKAHSSAQWLSIGLAAANENKIKHFCRQIRLTAHQAEPFSLP